MTTITSFINRLQKIGITVELSGNAPWIYLNKVNGYKVNAKYLAEHGFTAFWLNNNGTKITDIGRLFDQIRTIYKYDKALKNGDISNIICFGSFYYPICDGGKYGDDNEATGELKYFPTEYYPEHGTILKEQDVKYEIFWVHLGLGYYKQVRKLNIQEKVELINHCENKNCDLGQVHFNCPNCGEDNIRTDDIWFVLNNRIEDIHQNNCEACNSALTFTYDSHEYCYIVTKSKGNEENI